jgi:hypothetical protein
MCERLFGWGFTIYIDETTGPAQYIARYEAGRLVGFLYKPGMDADFYSVRWAGSLDPAMAST